MAVHPTNSDRVAAWEKRLKVPVVIAAAAVLPLVALGLSQPEGAWHTGETVGRWAVWLTFVVEVAIMLAVVDDRLAWTSGHRLEVLVVVLSAPLVPLVLAVAPGAAPAPMGRSPPHAAATTASTSMAASRRQAGSRTSIAFDST
jgi:hypothetical protein